MTRRSWREGYWPLDPDVEKYLKARILIAEPGAEFFYSKGFAEEARAAEAKRVAAAERKERKADGMPAIAADYTGPTDAAGNPMHPRLVAYWKARGYFQDEDDEE